MFMNENTLFLARLRKAILMKFVNMYKFFIQCDANRVGDYFLTF
jgi:hypothetical protein